MSRGGRGGGRGGFANNVPPMGLTFADIQAMSREATENYPVRLRERGAIARISEIAFASRQGNSRR